MASDQSTPLWDYEDVARKLKCSTKTVKRRWDDGTIPEPVVNTRGMVRWNPAHFNNIEILSASKVSSDNSGQS